MISTLTFFNSTLFAIFLTDTYKTNTLNKKYQNANFLYCLYPLFRPYLPGAVKIYHTVDLMTAFHSSAPPSACPGREELGLFLDLIKIFPGI